MEMGEINSIIPIPVIILIDCAIPPPEKVASASIQKAEEIIEDFSDQRLSWALPDLSYLKNPIWFLQSHEYRGTTQKIQGMCRTAKTLNPTSEATTIHRGTKTLDIKELDYLNPWIWLPHREQFEGNTVARVLFCLDEAGGAKLIEIDWEDRDEDDDLYSESHLLEIMKDEDIPDTPSNRAKLLQALKDAITESKTAYQTARRVFRERQAAFTPEQKEALREMRIIKYYPKNFTKSTSRYVNRYYRHAHAVYPENINTDH
jgi:hypothetical protein